MIFEILSAAASTWLLVLALVIQPAAASCPSTWHLSDGIRRTGDHVGEFTCAPTLPLGCGGATAIDAAPCPPERVHVRARIYCTGGSRPIQRDHQTVGCQR